ncbi:OLC1v1022233C1 [Oldenlandia corymbosa var. corymbosa]|uniref:OLC1v1022233C1 n=1 Tax=Oldenlandia corymbosa var. corymbosa TaxID=529605 RepID=A0AAV1BXE3_OLDCO|nr:OLC1v1022233C1 [Oldenlandia corymbosa var. corymbosa]
MASSMSNSISSNGGSVKIVNNNSNNNGSKIERGHQMYRDGRHEEALGFYTEALSSAKTVPQKIALHSNRAACFLKLQDFKKAAEECTWVLELDQNHTGALMLRAQTLVTLKEYNSALFDVNRLIELNPSSEVYRSLQARLKTQLSLAPIPEDDGELEEEEEDDVFEGKEINAVEGHENKQEKQVIEAADPIEQRAEVKQIAPNSKGKSSEQDPSFGWQAIPKPKGHSQLDYSRWDRVEDESSEDDSSEEDEDDEDSRPQYRFRVRTVGVRPVK